MKKLIKLAIIAVVSLSVKAQEMASFLIGDFDKVGLAYDNTHMKFEGSSVPLNGFDLGYMRGLKISKSSPFFLEGGLKLKFLFGEGYLPRVDEMKYSFITFEIPVNLTYLFKIGSKGAIAPFGGFNFKFHVNGKAKFDGSGKSVNLFSDSDWSRYQLGWQAGLCIYISKIYLSAAYGTDLLKIYDDSSQRINTNGLTVSVGYVF